MINKNIFTGIGLVFAANKHDVFTDLCEQHLHMCAVSLVLAGCTNFFAFGLCMLRDLGTRAYIYMYWELAYAFVCSAMSRGRFACLLK